MMVCVRQISFGNDERRSRTRLMRPTPRAPALARVFHRHLDDCIHRGVEIVVRNSVILVDFIKLRLKQGIPLAEAVVDAGMAVIVCALVILFGPSFQVLAYSLMAGEVASPLISRMEVPVSYYLCDVMGSEPLRSSYLRFFAVLERSEGKRGWPDLGPCLSGHSRRGSG